MKALQALSSQILKKTKDAGQIKIEANQTKAKEKIAEQEQKLSEHKKERETQIEMDASHAYEREAQTLANQKRNAILAEKQAMLNEIFNKAQEEMANWSPETFASFLEGVIKQLDVSGTWTVVPGSRSVNLFKTDEVQAVLNKNNHVSVSDETVNQKAGFLVQQGGIDFNFCFDALVQELKKEFSPKLATLAFQTNE